MSLPQSTIEQLREAVCRGSFMLGTACGRCARCKENLDQISKATGMVPFEVVQKLKDTIESLELANATLRRRVESLEGVT